MHIKLKVVWSRPAKKQFENIDLHYQQRIKEKIFMLGDVTAPALDIRKLTYPHNHYRLRVGVYRIILTREGKDQEICHIVAVIRRTSTTYSVHEEQATYEYSIYQR